MRALIRLRLRKERPQLIRDRTAIAQPAKDQPGMLTDIVGFAIWASVSEEIDAKTREPIRARTCPIRLKPEDRQSGSVNRLLDGDARATIGSRRGPSAPDRKTAGRVIANFAQVVKMGGTREPVAGAS